MAVDRLRAIVAAAAPDLVETIKWNAPSFSADDAHLVTLGLERRGGVRIVLHRGAARRDMTGFAFDDPTGLAVWPAPDRGVVTFRDLPAIEPRAADLHDLIERWVAANRNSA